MKTDTLHELALLYIDMHTWTLTVSAFGSRYMGMFMILKSDSDMNALLASSTFSDDDSTYAENDPRAIC